MKMLSIGFIILVTLGSFSTALSQDDAKKAKVIINLTDQDKNPLTGEKLILSPKNGDKEYDGITDDEGKVTLKLPKGKTYEVSYLAVNGPVKFKAFEIPDKEGFITFTYNATYEVSESNVYRLDNVYFDTDKATLRASSHEALDHLVEVLEMKPDMKIEIAGHTDNRGDDQYNLNLSQNRAENVKKYLVEQGIDPKRIRAKGYGEAEPIESNSTEEGRQKNRRTEVRVLEQ